MTDRFYNSIYALYHAYFNQILGKGTCDSCAIGVLVAHSHNIQLKTYKHINRCIIPIYIWNRLFYTNEENLQIIKQDEYTPKQIEESLELISKTGYTEHELAQIEHAFESNTTITDIFISEKERMSDLQTGLFAVVKVLCKLDNITDEYVIDQYKKFFIYDPELKPVYTYPK